MTKPRVTVLMPVHEGERYLREAVDSILRQTFGDFELLAVDDGSRDRTYEILSSYRDRRIHVRRHTRNEGLIASLNEGLDLAAGEYVARMDADDVAHPERLARQVRFLDAQPDIAAVGTGVRNFGAATDSWTLRHEPAAIRARLLFETALSHPTVMLRASALERLGIRYDPEYPLAEDYQLFVELAERAALANLPETLLHYRFHGGQTSATNAEQQRATMRRIRARQLQRLGLRPTEADLTLHGHIGSGIFTASEEFLDRADLWLRSLCEAARALGPKVASAFDGEMGFRWARLCRRSRRLGLGAWRRFRASPLHREAGGVLRAEVALGALAGALHLGAHR